MVGITVSGLRKAYHTGERHVQALDGVSFQVQGGGVLALIGYSGCGKTTLFRHIAGLEQPDGGSIVFSGHERPRLGMMFQEPRLLPWLTVRENLLLALRRTTLKDHGAVVQEALVQVDLADCGQSYPDQLSGGMAQRVALARALCRQPDLLLMDEPFGALDALPRLQLQLNFRAYSAAPHDRALHHPRHQRGRDPGGPGAGHGGRRIVARQAHSPAAPREAGHPEFEQLKKQLLQPILGNRN
jgi:ABC-type nitrate/sulfonate/bicarbonate transport system ATPase subunit